MASPIYFSLNIWKSIISFKYIIFYWKMNWSKLSARYLSQRVIKKMCSMLEGFLPRQRSSNGMHCMSTRNNNSTRNRCQKYCQLQRCIDYILKTAWDYHGFWVWDIFYVPFIFSILPGRIFFERWAWTVHYLSHWTLPKPEVYWDYYRLIEKLKLSVIP